MHQSIRFDREYSDFYSMISAIRKTGVFGSLQFTIVYCFSVVESIHDIPSAGMNDFIVCEGLGFQYCHSTIVNIDLL